MKKLKNRVFFFKILCVLGIYFLNYQTILAADEGSLEQEAERQYNEERFRKLNSVIEDLMAANEAMQKKINALTEEVRLLRAELNRVSNNSVSKSDLEELDKKINQVNQSREEDKKVILDNIEKLTKLSQTVIKQKTEPVSNTQGADTTQKIPDKGYYYVIKKGDFLSGIVDAYRKEGVKVTLEQVLKANPGLKPEKIIPGQKIFIPDPNAK